MNEYMNHTSGTVAETVAKCYLEAYDELNGSKTYIMDAIDMHGTNRKRADKKQVMSADELGHASGIIEEVDGMMEQADESTRTLWEAMKNQLMGYMAWIKTLHAEYKGM